MIARLSHQLDEDRYQMEKLQRAEDERIFQRNSKAATTIQQCYRGYRLVNGSVHAWFDGWMDGWMD
jgi:hypothetical protein